jgi:hypothetical protein
MMIAQQGRKSRARNPVSSSLPGLMVGRKRGRLNPGSAVISGRLPVAAAVGLRRQKDRSQCRTRNGRVNHQLK